MTPRMSQRARAREIYREMAGALSPRQGAREAAPSLTLPRIARRTASVRSPMRGREQKEGGGEQAEQVARAEPSLTSRVRALYENSAVPVREIAALAGVTERTIYKYVAKGGWTKRNASAPDNAPAFAPEVAPVRGAGGRFIRREDKDKPFATGLKATDAPGRGRALVACRKAARLSRAARAKAAQEARDAALERALAFNARCLKDLRVHRNAYGKGRAPTALQLRIEGLLIGSVEWSLRRLETFVPPPLPPSPAPPPRYDPDDFRAWRRPPG